MPSNPVVDLPPKVLVWIDTETTGLNPRFEVPLELGLKVTNYDLEVLGSWSTLVQPEGWREKMKQAQPVVQEMHSASGLLGELELLPELRPRIDGQIMSWDSNVASYLAWEWLVREMKLPEGVYPMAGSSVQFDRAFALEHFPVLESFFTYRNIDVSSTKELCRIYNPRLSDLMKADERFQKANARHRVLDDISASIAELRMYRHKFFRGELR